MSSLQIPKIVNNWQLLPTLVARIFGALYNHKLLPSNIWLRPIADTFPGNLAWKRFKTSVGESLSKMKDAELIVAVTNHVPSDSNSPKNFGEFAKMMVETAQDIAWAQYQHQNPNRSLRQEQFIEHAKTCAHCFGAMASVLDDGLMAIAQEEHSFFHGHDVARIVQEDLATNYAMSLPDIRTAYKEDDNGDLSDQKSYYNSVKNNLLWKRGAASLTLILKHCFPHQRPPKAEATGKTGGC